MRFKSRVKYLVAVSILTGIIISVNRLEWLDPTSQTDVTKDEPQSVNITEMKIPDNKLSGETPDLVRVLQQKFQELNDSGLLMTTKMRNICGKGKTYPNCSKPLPPRLSEENIESIRKPVREVGIDKLREVIRAFDVKPEKKKYVIITGASSNHFQESEAALQSLHRNVLPHLTNYSLVYYDLGLSKEQQRLVREFSGAELKQFPYDKLPERFKYLQCYIWKPLIVLAHLQSAEFLLWMDSSISYSADIRPYFELVKNTGILITRNTFSFAQHVYLKMFSYFGDEPCQFSSYGETEGGFLVIHNEPFTRHLVIEPWSACALDPNCMCPEETKKMMGCDISQKYGHCHRYDQANIGYILIKLLRRNRESVITGRKYHTVRRLQRPSYLAFLETLKGQSNRI